MRLSIEHFGPIRSGEVELKPLTVLIGPNNSGKTYLAQLIYLLSKTLSARILDVRNVSRSFLVSHFLLHRFDEEIVEIDQSELSEEMWKQIGDEINDFVAELELALHESMMEYFNVGSMAQLSRTEGEEGSLYVSLRGSDQRLPLVEIGLQGSGEWVRIARPDYAALRIPKTMGAKQSLEDSDGLVRRFAVEQGWLRLAGEYGIDDRDEFYLPSARSGILTAWPLITALAVGAVRRRLGFEPISVGPLSGVTGDFLQQIIVNFGEPQSRRRADNRLDSAIEVLEGAILRGRVAVEDQSGEGSLLIYRGRDIDLPLQRASSMVAELAPLDLWLNDLVRPGDLLIIDEPEAHLHPANQRRIAQVLVRLINAGVRVICPTHSSLIVHQLSNHILAKDAAIDERNSLGFTDADVLDSDDIAVYAFHESPRGTEIRPVPVIEGFGISEEEFAAVAEQIGDQTYQLLTSAGDPS
jgi:predicted ATPase